MPPAASPACRHPARFVLGSLLLTLAATCLWCHHRSRGLAWQRMAAYWTGAPSPEQQHARQLRTLRLRVLNHYLHTAPTPPTPAILADLQTLTDSTLATLMEWMPQEPLARCGNLTAITGIPADWPVHTSLMSAALLGHGAPPIQQAFPHLHHPGFIPDHLDGLHLLEQCALRADAEGQEKIATDLLCRVARHPRADFSHVRRMIEHAVATDQPELALETLRDWRDDPPPAASAAERDEVSRSIARLALALNDLPLLRDELQRIHLLMDHNALDVTSPAANAWWNVAWPAAERLGNWSQLIPWLEARLRSHPHHCLNWRELATQPPPSPAYTIGLNQLIQSCLAARMDARAFEALLHLAWLDDPTLLARALPLASKLDRLNECEQWLLRFSSHQPDPLASRCHLIHQIARACLRDDQAPSASALLAWHLHQVPEDTRAAHLHLDLQTRNLPPFRAAILWRQHLKAHPQDLDALHSLVAVWKQAGQAHAALKELTSAPSLTPSLRLDALTLSIALRDTSAFHTALSRTLQARDPLTLPHCLDAIAFSHRCPDAALREHLLTHARRLHPTAPSLRQFASPQVQN